jgi:YD repeat-containing protein
MTQGVQRALETDPLQRHTVLACGLGHHPAGEVVRDQQCEQLAMVRTGNRVTSFVYDVRGMLQRIDTPNPAGGTFQQTFAYSFRGDLESYTDQRGVVVASTYNARRQKTSSTGPGDGSDYASATKKLVYDNNGKIEYMVDALGRATRSTYSPTAKLLTVQAGLIETGPGSFDASQAITTITNSYDSREWLLSITGPISGQITQITYDAAGRPLTITDAESRTVTRGYDANGQHTATTDYVTAVTSRTVQNTFDASASLRGI